MSPRIVETKARSEVTLSLLVESGGARWRCRVKWREGRFEVREVCPRDPSKRRKMLGWTAAQEGGGVGLAGYAPGDCGLPPREIVALLEREADREARRMFDASVAAVDAVSAGGEFDFGAVGSGSKLRGTARGAAGEVL